MGLDAFEKSLTSVTMSPSTRKTILILSLRRLLLNLTGFEGWQGK
jgi:hypothetical protein